MTKVDQYANNVALTSGLAGLKAGGAALQEAGQRVLSSTVRTLNSGSVSIKDTVSLSDEARSTLQSSSLEDALLGEQQAALVYSAAGKVVEGAQASWGTLLSVLA